MVEFGKFVGLKMKDVMIDLETLGLSNDAPILSIGAAKFDPMTGTVGNTFYENVDWINDQKDRPLDRNTVKWWLEQDKAAQKDLLERANIKLSLALHRLAEFIPQDANVWANGPTFDISILENAYHNHAKRATPWGFRNVRCCRTIKDLAAPLVDFNQFTSVGTAHNALDDCIFQIKWTSAAYQALRAPKRTGEDMAREWRADKAS